MAEVKESVRVLQECAEMQLKKAKDYQNEASSVTQGMYYRRGLNTINDIIWAKLLRLLSLVETLDHDSTTKPNFESIEDSYKDMINYASFGAAWCRGKVPGQEDGRDLLNRPVVTKEPGT